MKLLDAMKKCLDQCHMDENPGVAIGAREMAIAIARCLPGEAEIREKLNLGSDHYDPSQWAKDNCINPVRVQNNGN